MKIIRLSWLYWWSCTIKRWFPVLIIICISSGLNVFVLIHFPKSRCISSPIKLLQSFSGCLLLKVVIFCNVERKFSLTYLLLFHWLSHVKWVSSDAIFLPIIVGEDKLYWVLQIQRLSIGEIFFRQINRN